MAGILNIQMSSTLGNKEINLKKVEHFIKKNSDKKIDLVVLPEFFATGVNNNYSITLAEEENNTETINKLSKIAQKYNTNIVCGTIIEKSDDKYYNTAFVLDRNGKIICKYRKIHLHNYMGGNENEYITAGEEICTADLDFGKIGLAICFDIRYPLHFQKLARENVDIIVSPAAWCIPKEVYEDSNALKYAQETWIAINRTRAFDNQVFLITSNQTKEMNPEICAIGTSLIVAPTSEIIANAKNDQGAIYTQIDLQSAKYYRSLCPLAHID